MSFGNHRQTNMGVVQFISTTIYFLLFQSTADRNHPSVMAFEVYIQRILNCSTNNVTVPVIFTALFYVDRYAKRLRLNGISRRDSEAQILVASLMLADVYHNDAAYAVCSWSELSSFSMQECIKMRKQFLEIIDYDLYISFVQYNRWIVELKRISNLVSTVMFYNENKPALPINTPPMSYQSLMRTTRHPQQVQIIEHYPQPSPNKYRRSASLMSGNVQEMRINRNNSDTAMINLTNPNLLNQQNISLSRSRSGNEIYDGQQFYNNIPPNQPAVVYNQGRNHSIPTSATEHKVTLPYLNNFVSPLVQPQNTESYQQPRPQSRNMNPSFQNRIQ